MDESTLAALAAEAKLTGHGYQCWDEIAVEVETGEFLYGLVRAAKPKLIVESGTGKGYATRYLAAAAAANGHGEIVTFEVHQGLRADAADLFAGMPVTVAAGVGADAPGLKPDLVFCDCVSDQRDRDIRYWLTHPGRPLVVIHDAKRPYPYHLGEGVHIPGHDGLWVGRAKPAAFTLHTLAA